MAKLLLGDLYIYRSPNINLAILCLHYFVVSRKVDKLLDHVAFGSVRLICDRLKPSVLILRNI